MDERTRYAIQIFETVPATGLLEICKRISEYLGIEQDKIDTALLKVWDELQAERDAAWKDEPFSPSEYQPEPTSL